jgi:hypothetical protein
MDATAHQITYRLVDEAVTPDGIVTGESRRDYGDFVMAALARAGMAGVAMRFILDLELLRIKRRQALAQQVDGFATHAGSTFLKGLTVTFSYTPAAT